MNESDPVSLRAQQKEKAAEILRALQLVPTAGRVELLLCFVEDAAAREKDLKWVLEWVEHYYGEAMAEVGCPCSPDGGELCPLHEALADNAESEAALSGALPADPPKGMERIGTIRYDLKNETIEYAVDSPADPAPVSSTGAEQEIAFLVSFWRERAANRWLLAKDHPSKPVGETHENVAHALEECADQLEKALRETSRASSSEGWQPSRDDIETVAGFIVGWHPGYEDAIAWGSSGPSGNTEANAVYQAAQRLLKALPSPPAGSAREKQ